jgi:hypothetical protein
MSHDLSQITKDLGSTHKSSKELEKKLKDCRAKFFEAVDEQILSSETLARQTITVPEDVEPEAYVKQFHPGWRVVDPGSKEHTYIIEEDPSFKKFVYVNHDDGNVYRRNVSQAGPSLDNERLKEEDPDLWKRISVSKVQRVRVLKDMEEISNKDLAAMQEYFVPGPMTVKLDAPRKAKPDELDA